MRSFAGTLQWLGPWTPKVPLLTEDWGPHLIVPLALMSPSSKLAHLLFLYHPKTQTEADHGMYKMCRFCCFCTTQRHRQRQTQTMECTKCVDFAAFVPSKDTDHGMYKMCRFFAVFVPPKDRDRHRPWNVQMCTFLLFLYHPKTQTVQPWNVQMCTFFAVFVP